MGNNITIYKLDGSVFRTLFGVVSWRFEGGMLSVFYTGGVGNTALQLHTTLPFSVE
jgi:hypothetical protein